MQASNEAYKVEQVVSDDTGYSKPEQTWEGTLGKFPDTLKVCYNANHPKPKGIG